MALHNDLGKKGEELAGQYLSTSGYSILEKNWRFSKAEIDLIVQEKNILVFVEVKSREKVLWGFPESFISKRKIQLIMDAAYHYMELKKYDWEIRFDVISVIIPKKGKIKIDHFKDAFVP